MAPIALWAALAAFGLMRAFGPAAQAAPETEAPAFWRAAWPMTDFGNSRIDLSEVSSGGPAKDGIPSIDDPKFVSAAQAEYDDREPVIGLEINGCARAYPLSILIYHEIANDVVGGIPVAVTYCPLCNAAIVYDRSLDGAAVEFGVSGLLRKSDMIMYDRKTESWWQQFTGRAIVGALAGRRLKRLPARLESFAEFKARHDDGWVLVPNDAGARPYGRNPYINYDTARRPFAYDGPPPDGIRSLERVVAVGDTAWRMSLIRARGEIIEGDLRLAWTAGQASALDAPRIARGREVGTVVVQRRDGAGAWRDIPYDVTFAFVFHAFKPEGQWRLE